MPNWIEDILKTIVVLAFCVLFFLGFMKFFFVDPYFVQHCRIGDVPMEFCK
jgi:hypothetical protein